MAANPRIIHALRFLALHFGQTLGVKFHLDNYPVKSEEIFNPLCALSPIAQRAEAASLHFYNRPLIASTHPNPDSAFGVVVDLIPELQSVDLILLIAAAEDFFGISGINHEEGTTHINLRPILDSWHSLAATGA